jgi:hypothetical protein
MKNNQFKRPNMKKVTQEEAEFMYYKNGTAGSFRTALYDLYFKADWENQCILLNAYPYLNVALNYQMVNGYWQDLQKRWKNG